MVISRTKSDESVLEFEVTQLSTAAIDPALFDVPGNFSLVESIRQEPAPPLVIRLKQAYERLKRHALLFA